METKECKSNPDHDGHLCVLASAGKVDEIRALVKAPQYICFNCGRVADSGHNLCNPMPLEHASRPPEGRPR